MTWSCVVCGNRAVAEVDTGVAVAMCAAHGAAFAPPRRWCAVPECTVPTHQELCEAHQGVLAAV